MFSFLTLVFFFLDNAAVGEKKVYHSPMDSMFQPDWSHITGDYHLEDAKVATSAASIMGIISSTLFALLTSGYPVVSVKDTGGTAATFNECTSNFIIEVVQYETADYSADRGKVKKRLQSALS